MTKPLPFVMKRSLADWNSVFEHKILSLDEVGRSKAGAMLEIIPSREDWRDFVECVKANWELWRGINRYPFCLIILYDGVAFYDYESGQYWDRFSETLETDISGGPRSKLNDRFSSAVTEIGLKLFASDFVGSAVFHIGVPVHSWHHFLQICKWALRHDEWKSITDLEWKSEIERRALTQVRLKNFLLDNRKAATDFIQTILDARRLLHARPDLPFDEIPQRNFLRVEYFDEVPETAEFLFPEHSKACESLLESRPYLFWHQEKARIELHLPAIPRQQLKDAYWKVGNLSQAASANSDRLEVNSLSFQPDLDLVLHTNEGVERKILHGILPFGMYDGRRFVNRERTTLPLQSYTIVSPERLEVFSVKDFDEEENRPNESYELKDGRSCFVTQLDPIGKSPKVSFSTQGKSFQFKLKRHAKIEAYFFFGEGSDAVHFTRKQNSIETKGLPIICVALPYETDNLAFLKEKFEVGLDSVEKFRVYGKWEKRLSDDLREYFVWRWSTDHAVRKNHGPVTLRSKEVANPFANLKNYRDQFTPVNLLGNHNVFVRSETLGFGFSEQLTIVEEQEVITKCWNNLPSTFLPFFLLSQKTAGMTWNEILLAKDIVAPNERDFSQALLRRYARLGYLRQHGQVWQIHASEAVIHNSNQHICQVQFCGDPSLLWGVYNEMARRKKNLLNEKKIVRIGLPTLYPFPPIEVVIPTKGLPVLQMNWRDDLRSDLWAVFDKLGVRVINDLWRK